jgi:hypothetical protein
MRRAARGGVCGGACLGRGVEGARSSMSMVGEKGDEEGEEGATTMAAVAAAKVVVAAAGQYSC